MTTTQNDSKKPARPHGIPAWRTLIKAHDHVTFRTVADAADTAYQHVIRMSRGEIATTPEVHEAVAKLLGVPDDVLDEWAQLRLDSLRFSREQEAQR